MFLLCVALAVLFQVVYGQNTSEVALLSTSVRSTTLGRIVNISCLATGTRRYSAISLNIPTDTNLHVTLGTKRKDTSIGISDIIERFPIISASWKRSTNFMYVVTDERWEDFPIIKTAPKLSHVAFIKSEQIVVSVFGKEEVTIEYGELTRRYKVIINQNHVQIMLCITVCTSVRDRIQVGNILKANSWSTFKITLNSGRVAFGVTTSTNQELWTAKNDQRIVGLKLMLASTASVSWKIHRLTFISTTKPTNLTIPLINKESICLRFYVNQCEKCTLSIVVSGAQKTHKKIIIKSAPEWQHELVDALTILRPSEITFETIGEKSSSYWLIADIQECHTTDFKLISAEVENAGHYNNLKNIHCQVIGDDSPPVSLQRVTKIQKESETCPMAKIGWNCSFDCSAILATKYCDQTTVCWSGKCVCTPGYVGQYCYKACEREGRSFLSRTLNKYGYDCARDCHQCKDNKTCSFVTGNCASGCVEDFTGDKCDIFKFPVLFKPPRSVLVTATEITIEQKNWTWNGQTTPTSYIVQYRKVATIPWISVGTEQTFGKWIETKIVSLQPFVNYEVRVILRDRNGNSYQKKMVPMVRIRTDCLDIKPENLSMVETKATAVWLTNVRIDWKAQQGTCRSSLYKVKVNGINITMNETGIYLPNIPWNTQLNITFERNRKDAVKVQFRTSLGPSNAVDDLKIFSDSPTEISLHWKPPKHPGGDIIQYNVQYKHERYLACSELLAENSSLKQIFTKNLRFSIQDLHPYSTYIIMVTPASQMYTGTSLTVHSMTTATPQADEKVMVKATVGTTTVTLKSTLITNCTSVLGPVEYQIQLDGSSPWSNTSQMVRTNESQHVFQHLIPYTKYLATTNIQRPGSPKIHNENKVTTEVITLATAPPAVINLTAYSKTNTSMYLRWKEPFPPYGILEAYQVELKCSAFSRSTAITYNCPLWKGYICYDVIDGIEPNCRYQINVSAKNTDIPHFSVKETIYVVTTEEQSSPPANILARWLENLSVMLISWSHPRQPNGLIKQFTIIIRQSDPVIRTPDLTVSTVNVGPSNYTPNYYISVKVPNIIFPSTVQVAIRADNSLQGAQGTGEVVLPPELPFFEVNPSFLNDSATGPTINITIPSLRSGYSNCSLLIIVSDNSEIPIREFTSDIPYYEDILVKQGILPGISWLAGVLKPDRAQKIFMVGEFIPGSNNNYELTHPETTDVTLLLLNTYKHEIRCTRYNLGQVPVRNGLPWYLHILIWSTVTGVTIFLCYDVYRRIKRRNLIRRNKQIVSREIYLNMLRR